ncbi:TetR/AcrR family transcriptional regulator [Microvirga rosea]|uniref:TetR/AcrR family transcriptional regulator n=1 Tax=Microvirga rosea TaxID=2715425 RepID=UPI001D0A804A|nr:TetR/AcrR family transcriptional regulator [Microvirga rosea]MCB8823276.1 TetR/AcrR family transcriptional regulator [Microvirga rosea]
MGQETKERVAQKQRTRMALLKAARELLVDGETPSVPDAADRAGISRATAYRYFSTPDALAQEAILDAIASEFETIGTLLPDDADPAEKAQHIVSAVLAMVLQNEALFRTFLGLVSGGGTSRGGRRVRWISAALEPLAARLPQEAFERLVHGLSLLCGIETVVVLRDICGLQPAEMDRTVRWIARTLVTAALKDGDAP